MNFFKYRSVQYPILYIKLVPFYLNYKSISRLRFKMQLIATTVWTTIIVFILLNNFFPTNTSIVYTLGQKNSNITPLGPSNRVTTETKRGQTVFHQTHDLVYFSTKMKSSYDKATVRITFQNQNKDQPLSLGYKDQEGYHYDTQIIDMPELNSLSWKKLGIKPILYQKERRYISVEQFLKNPPKDDIIGVYDTNTIIGSTSETILPHYTPQKERTIIDLPIRGRHTLYVYLYNEPFEFTVEKQDLNWYEDPDPLTIKIFKGDDLVYQRTADDDGIKDKSRKTLPPQEITVQNLDPKLLENGVYKIVIDASDDTIIKKITTNLHKIVFAGNLFLAGNKNVYSPIISSTSKTNLYTDSLLLSAKTFHNQGKQKIQVDDQSFTIAALNFDFNIVPKEVFSSITIPQNDVVINGFMGYFSATPGQFFLPTQYHILPISQKEDFDLVNYILTDYSMPQTINGWQVAESTFDLHNAYIQNGLLSWVIQAPHLQENNAEILIKDIEIKFQKNSKL